LPPARERLVRPYYLPTDDSTVKVVWINRFTIEMQATEGHRVKASPGIQPVVWPDLKAARSSTSGPTKMFCGKPMPGTANCRELGE
jgi:hypothetical protein